MASMSDPDDTSGRLIPAGKVNGTTVYNTAGEKLGTVYDVMIDKVSGTAEYAVMSFGGFLGIGDKFHPIPWKMLTYDEAARGYVIDTDRTRLEGAPVYSEDDPWDWGDANWGRRIDDYYGSPGYGMTGATGRRRVV